MGNLLRKYMESMDLDIKLYKVYGFSKLPLAFRKVYLQDELWDYFKKFGFVYILESGNRKYMIQRFYSLQLNGYSYIITSDKDFFITEEQLLSELSLDGISDSFSEIFELLLQHLEVKIVD